MILTQHNSMTTETNVSSAARNFTIAATREAFEALSGGLYSNRHAAILRELSTNAYDSHVNAGCPDKPVEIQLPTELDNTFLVRDHGTGMSHDTVTDLYTTYFGSDKRRSNDLTGAFGLGSKSPLSLVDSFLVLTRTEHEKVARLYGVSLSNDGVPAVTLLDDQNTELPHAGTEVSFSVEKKEDIHLFRSALSFTLDFLPTEPTINIAYTPTVPWRTNAVVMNDGRKYTQYRENSSAITIVQGPVGYKVDTRELWSRNEDFKDKNFRDLLYKLWQSGISLAIEVPMGTVRPSLSRETLSLDDNTRSALQKYISPVLQRFEARKRLEHLYGITDYQGLSVFFKEEWEETRLRKKYPNAQQRHVVAGIGTRFFNYNETSLESIVYSRYRGRVHKQKAYNVHIPRDLWDSGMTGVYYLPEDSTISSFSRTMKPLIRNGTLPKEVVLIKGPKVALDRLNDRLPATHRIKTWRKEDFPKPPKKSKPRSGKTPKRYLRWTLEDNVLSDTMAVDRHTLEAYLDDGKVIVERTQLSLLPKSKWHLVDYVYIVDEGTARRTKFYKKLVEFSTKWVGAVIAEHDKEIRKRYSRREMLDYLTFEKMKHDNILRVFLDSRLRDVLPQKYRPIATWGEKFEDTEIRHDFFTHRDNEAVRRRMNALREGLQNRYPMLGYVRYITHRLTVDRELFHYIVGKEGALRDEKSSS